MTASGKKLESKNVIEDVMPYENWRLPDPLVKIVMEYAMDVPFLKPCFFSGSDHALLKTLFLAEHAGPLDKFEFFARRHITKELENKSKTHALLDRTFIMGSMQGTLIQLLVSRLDVSIRNEKGEEMKENKGMAESLFGIVAELLPNRLADVREQAELASPDESLDDKQIRESTNVDAITDVFEAIKQNNENITKQAIETFKEFVKSKKSLLLNDQGYLTNNRYPMDLLHLMYVAFDVLANRGGELPSINGSDCGRWYGKKADLFCFKIIGESLQQRELDSLPSLRQKLTRGLYYVLNNKPAPRTIDVDGSAFRGVGSNYLLGVNSYYDDSCGAVECGCARGHGG